MKIEEKNILLISPEAWTHLHVSKHHYAIELAKRGNRVFFLGPPTAQFGIRGTEYDGVCLVEYQGFPKGMSYYPRGLRHWLQRRMLAKIQRLTQVSFDMIWSFDNSVFFDLDALPSPLLRISHIVDLNQNFQFERAASTADVCFTCSRPILEKLLRCNRNAHFINHGYSPIAPSEDFQLEDEPGLKVGYAGNLDIPYMDWELLSRVIEDRKDITFYFAGSVEKNKTRLKRSNIRYLGVLPKAAMMTFLGQMDILMLCYQSDLYRDQVANSHKLMEYLSTGKPIIASRMLDYEGMDLLYMCDHQSQWKDLLDELVTNLNEWETKEKAQKRINFAVANTYEKQLSKTEARVKSL